MDVTERIGITFSPEIPQILSDSKGLINANPVKFPKLGKTSMFSDQWKQGILTDCLALPLSKSPGCI